jgi:hypothetical protein
MDPRDLAAYASALRSAASDPAALPESLPSLALPPAPPAFPLSLLLSARDPCIAIVAEQQALIAHRQAELAQAKSARELEDHRRAQDERRLQRAFDAQLRAIAAEGGAVREALRAALAAQQLQLGAVDAAIAASPRPPPAGAPPPEAAAAAAPADAVGAVLEAHATAAWLLQLRDAVRAILGPLSAWHSDVCGCALPEPASWEQFSAVYAQLIADVREKLEPL